MRETRKLAAILVSDVVGYSRLAGANEDRILARLRTLRSDLIDPTIAVHHGRIVKRTGDGSIIEFRSVVDAVNCAIEVQRAMVERNAEVAPDKRIEFRIGIHLGDVVEESDGAPSRRRMCSDTVSLATLARPLAHRPRMRSTRFASDQRTAGRMAMSPSDVVGPEGGACECEDAISAVEAALPQIFGSRSWRNEARENGRCGASSDRTRLIPPAEGKRDVCDARFAGAIRDHWRPVKPGDDDGCSIS